MIRQISLQIVVVVLATAAISIAYIYVLPRYFQDQPTYLILVAGLVCAAAASIRISRMNVDGWGKVGWGLALGIGGIAAGAALLLSLLFILNVRGS